MIEHALFCSDMNWVERRWTREQNLSKGAPEIWQAVTTAIDNACQTLKQHYSNFADISFKPQNGHRILVTVNRKQVPVHINSYISQIDVQISYENNDHRIGVIVGYNKTPKYFPIQSDEQHAFLVNGGKEISPDEFSQLILESTFFKVQETGQSSSGSGNLSPWG